MKYSLAAIASAIIFVSTGGTSNAQTIGDVVSVVGSLVSGPRANVNTQVGIVGANGTLDNHSESEGPDSVAVTGLNAILEGSSGGASVNATTQIGYIGDRAVVTNTAIARSGGKSVAGVNATVRTK